LGDGASHGWSASPNASERMQQVVLMLESRDAVTVAELARDFSVSEVTIRSDLATLAKQGMIARTRGGARGLQRGQSELAFDLRLSVKDVEKRAIARAAADLVHDGDSVALDSSTTAYYVALELRQRSELVVVTNGLLIAAALAGAPGVSVIVPGGTLRLPAMSLVGEFASGVLKTTQISKGFFGARGVSLERGLMDLNPEEVRIKRETVEACEQVIGIFDHTKWRRTALLSFVPTGRIDTIVTDNQAPEDAVHEWRNNGVEVVLADLNDDAAAPAPVRGLRRAVAPVDVAEGVTPEPRP
jgi:DeoR/GlpR family transcriptional regulator of sugar metabolism